MKNGSFCTVTFKNKEKGGKATIYRRLPASQYRRNNKVGKITISLTLAYFSGKDYKCMIKPRDDRYYWQMGFIHLVQRITN